MTLWGALTIKRWWNRRLCPANADKTRHQDHVWEVYVRPEHQVKALPPG